MCVCVVLKKKEILPYTTVWMNLEDIMLRKIIQSQKDNYYMIHLMGYCIYTRKLIEQGVEWWLPRPGGKGK